MSENPAPPEIVNVAQAERWNAEVGEHWVTHDERYAATLRPFGDRVLEAAGLVPGMKVVDIGCGFGATTVAAARRVAPDGEARGVDISRPMIMRAVELAAADDVANVEFVVGDAQVYPFAEADFDVAISRFGVMFFDDPLAAFTNIGRAIRPGGRLAFSSWQGRQVNEWMTVPFMAMAPYVGPPPTPMPGQPGGLWLTDADEILELLHGSGFVDVALEDEERPLVLGGWGTAADAVEFAQCSFTARTMLANASAETRAQALAAMREALVPYETPEGVQLGSRSWIVTARHPT